MTLMMIRFVVQKLLREFWMDTLIVLVDGFFVAVHPDFDLLVVAARIRVRLWCHKNPAPRMTWWPWFMFWHTFTAVCCLFQSVASFFYCTALLDSHHPQFSAHSLIRLPSPPQSTSKNLPKPDAKAKTACFMIILYLWIPWQLLQNAVPSHGTPQRS